jgi:hypothetical protein
MDNRVDKQLRKSGWFPGRHVGLKSEAAALGEEGFRVWDDLLAFLAEYTGLVITSDDGARMIWIGAARSIRETDSEWARAYSDVIHGALAPVGGYSHMSIYLSQGGGFYGGFDSEYGRLASDFRELIDALLNQNPPVSLDRRLD